MELVFYSKIDIDTIYILNVISIQILLPLSNALIKVKRFIKSLYRKTVLILIGAPSNG